MGSVATSRGITSPLCHPQNLYSINSLSHRFELGEEDGCGTLECNAVPLLCVTMASSGFAATDRQLCQPLVAASSPGALAWLQTLMCPAGTTACCTHSTLLHTLSLVLSLDLGQGLGLDLVTALDTPPWPTVPAGYLLAHFPSQLVHRAPQKPAIYLSSFGAKKENHAALCTCCI